MMTYKITLYNVSWNHKIINKTVSNLENESTMLVVLKPKCEDFWKSTVSIRVSGVLRTQYEMLRLMLYDSQLSESHRNADVPLKKKSF